MSRFFLTSFAIVLLSCSGGRTSSSKNVVDEFTDYYLTSNPNRAFWTTFYGIPSWQNPMDLWVTQELITHIKPDFIIETGTMHGGTALYYASILKNLGLKKSKVVTIDINQLIEKSIYKIQDKNLKRTVNKLFQDYVISIESNSVDASLVSKLKKMTKNKTVMVSLDSCHNSLHVQKELELYSPLVSKGSYLIVQDTIIDKKKKWIQKYASCEGYPTAHGPKHALKRFLEVNSQFEIDKFQERFLLTFYPDGYLRKK